MEQVILPVRTFGLMGIKNLILTNAAGSLNSDMTPGSLMLITDHLNCLGVNPLRGPNDKRFGPRFPDMSEVYDREFRQIASDEANAIAHERFEKGLDETLIDFMNRGVYCALSGPTYETPAEIRKRGPSPIAAHFHKAPCGVNVAMLRAEKAYRAELEKVSIADLGVDPRSSLGAAITTRAFGFLGEHQRRSLPRA